MAGDNGDSPKFLQVTGLEIVDPSGKGRIHLGYLKDLDDGVEGPVFRLLDPDGTIRMAIGIDDRDGTTKIVIGDKDGNQRFSLGTDAEAATLFVGDAQGQLRIALGCENDDDGNPTIHFYDEGSNIMLAAGVGPDGKPVIAYRENPEDEMKNLIGEW